MDQKTIAQQAQQQQQQIARPRVIGISARKPFSSCQSG